MGIKVVGSWSPFLLNKESQQHHTHIKGKAWNWHNCIHHFDSVNLPLLWIFIYVYFPSQIYFKKRKTTLDFLYDFKLNLEYQFKNITFSCIWNKLPAMNEIPLCGYCSANISLKNYLVTLLAFELEIRFLWLQLSRKSIHIWLMGLDIRKLRCISKAVTWELWGYVMLLMAWGGQQSRNERNKILDYDIWNRWSLGFHNKNVSYL